MHTMLAGAFIVALCALGCGVGASDDPGAHDVVETVDGRSAAHTLVALLSVRAAPDATGAPRWLHWSQIRRVRFGVDELEWGLFDTDAGHNDDAADCSAT